MSDTAPEVVPEWAELGVPEDDTAEPRDADVDDDLQDDGR